MCRTVSGWRKQQVIIKSKKLCSGNLVWHRMTIFFIVWTQREEINRKIRRHPDPLLFLYHFSNYSYPFFSLSLLMIFLDEFIKRFYKIANFCKSARFLFQSILENSYNRRFYNQSLPNNFNSMRTRS